MNTVQYGEWKIAADVDKTKLYYRQYKKNPDQANRNFAEYCKKLTAEEKAFFDSFGIDPVCCEIEHFGADKKGNFPCGGYYFVYGEYLEHPPEDLITVEELTENGFIDERPDPRINIGIFEFEFQCEDYEFSDIPEDMPKGFICIRFHCEDMKWLLPEKPEVMMYEPPRFWEIHKIIKEKINNIKLEAADLEETKSEFTRILESSGIVCHPLSKKEIAKHKKEWVNAFSPADADIKEIKELCLRSRKYNPYLWHIFSFEILSCETEDKAKELFNRENKKTCVIVSNVDDIAYRLANTENLTAALLEHFTDVTVTASDFSWTYTKTHEGSCGPYFYKK